MCSAQNEIVPDPASQQRAWLEQHLRPGKFRVQNGTVVQHLHGGARPGPPGNVAPRAWSAALPQSHAVAVAGSRCREGKGKGSPAPFS